MTYDYYKKIFLTGLVLLVTFTGIQAKEVPAKPSEFKYVYDEAGLLKRNEIRALQNRLAAYEKATSTQIAIVIERSLEGDDVVDYSVRLAHDWGIGQEGKDNGILIYASAEDKKLGIATGYGVEGFLTDAMSSRIRTQILSPAFKEGRYYDGLNRTVAAIQELAGGEFVNDGKRTSKKESKGWIAFIVILVFLVVFIGIIAYVNRSNRYEDDDDDGGYYRGGRYDEHPDERRRSRSSGGGGWIFLPGFGGGFGGGDSGGGDFGGGSDWGDFGGGDFGGGGSFGDW